MSGDSVLMQFGANESDTAHGPPGVDWLNATGCTAAAPVCFPDRAGNPDKAHFQHAGATKLAQFVAEELRRLQSPLAEYLK